MNIMTLDWALALLVLVIAGGLLYQLMALVPFERLVRCPEQGAITFIEVKSAPPDKPTPSGVVVQHCGLWGDRKGCAQGCLARYGETRRGFHIDHHALRTYDQ